MSLSGEKTMERPVGNSPGPERTARRTSGHCDVRFPSASRTVTSRWTSLVPSAGAIRDESAVHLRAAAGSAPRPSGPGPPAAQFAGGAAAEIKSALSYLTPGNGEFPPGEAVGVFQRGSINVKCYGTTPPKLGGAVYVLRATTETAGLTNVPAGSFTAMADGTTAANTVQLTNCQWGGPADADGVAELVILTKANA